MAVATRVVAVSLIGIGLWCCTALAQAPQPDDALPPGVKGEVRSLTGQILDLKSTILELKGLGADAQGAPSSITGKVVSLGAAIQDLKGAGTGVAVTETARPPAPRPKAPPRREVKIYLPADVLFDFDRADLRTEAGAVLERVATVLKSDPTASATIEGYTDGKGNDQYNQALSERRAQSVRLWLGTHGVTSSMAARGFGKIRPVAPNTLPNGADNPDGRQKNRRVEITFTTAQ
jgi:outer membrane protein OmpA-like peptidoglycan-associated protein